MQSKGIEKLVDAFNFSTYRKVKSALYPDCEGLMH